MSGKEEIPASLIDDLLALETRERRAALLRRNGLLDAAGLDALLDAADELLGSDPGRARELAEACIELSEDADAPETVPKANYILAGAADLNGDFKEALELTRRAHDGYEKLGLELEALRTEIGRMRILIFSGEYEKALEVEQVIADILESSTLENELNGTSENIHLLKARKNQNRGLCYELLGRYEDALESYAVAEAGYASLEMYENMSEVSSNRAILLINTGRATEAVEMLTENLRHFEESGHKMPQIRDTINLGYAYHQLGDYTSSLAHFEEARKILEPLEALSDESGLLLDTAAAYLELNLIEEALSAYREAYDLLVATGAEYEKALAAHGIGIVLTIKRDFEEAEKSLWEAESFFEEIGNVPLRVVALLDLSELSSLLGRGGEAQKLAGEAYRLISRSREWPLQSFYVYLKLAELSLPDTKTAESYLDPAKKFLEEMSLPQLRYRFAECLGQVRVIQGEYEEAEILFEQAIDEIERVRGTVTQDALRAMFLRDKYSVYEKLLLLKLESGDSRKALEIAERAKSRSLTDLLTGVSNVAAGSGDDTHEERLGILQAELSAVYNTMLAVPEDPGEPVPDLRGRAAELEEEIARLRLQAAASERHVEDVFASSENQGVEATYPEDTVLLAYHVVGAEVIAFISTPTDVRVVRNLCDVESIRELLRKLDSQWDRFRSGRRFSEKQAEMLEKSTRRVLSKLYEMLVEPAERLLQNALSEIEELYGDDVPKLAVIPHGPLHQAPFHAFYDGEKYLIERFEISYAPSAAVFALCQKRNARVEGDALIVGLSDALIPKVREEATVIAQSFQRTKLLLDEQASIAAVSEAISGRSVVHFACHGMFRSDNPMFSSLKLHDGWMLASEIMKLDLEGAMVALSACESGRNVVVGGDEILGLTRAFLGARAATLLVSLWIVNDDTTAPLMRHYYENLIAGRSPATALREAQLAARRDHPHPYYWAPFIVIGGR